MRSTVTAPDRKSTRLNSSHQINSYAVFCLKKQILFIDEETGWNIHHIQHQANVGTHQYNSLILIHPNCHRSIFFVNDTATTEIYTLSLHDALPIYSSRISLRGRSAASLRQNCVTVFSFSKNHFSSPSGRWSIVLLISSWGSTL